MEMIYFGELYLFFHLLSLFLREKNFMKHIILLILIIFCFFQISCKKTGPSHASSSQSTASEGSQQTSRTYNPALNEHLVSACKSGDLKKVKQLLDQGADLNATVNGVPALIWATNNGHIEVVKLLVEKGADINIQDKDGDTPLIVASLRGYFEIVQYLKHNYAYLNAISKSGKTALNWAYIKGYKKISEYLLQNGAYKITNEQIKKIERSIEKDDVVALQNNLFPGIDINELYIGSFDYPGSIFTFACSKGKIKSVKYLIKHGANPKSFFMVADSHISPIRMAVSSKNIHVVRLLIDSGADINVTIGHHCGTSIIIAIEDNNLEIVELLLNKGANPNIWVHNGNSALMVAIEKRHIKIAKLLIARGANVNYKNFYNKNTPLKLARKHGLIEIEQNLIQAGASE